MKTSCKECRRLCCTYKLSTWVRYCYCCHQCNCSEGGFPLPLIQDWYTRMLLQGFHLQCSACHPDKHGAPVFSASGYHSISFPIRTLNQLKSTLSRPLSFRIPRDLAMGFLFGWGRLLLDVSIFMVIALKVQKHGDRWGSYAYLTFMAAWNLNHKQCLKCYSHGTLCLFSSWPPGNALSRNTLYFPISKAKQFFKSFLEEPASLNDDNILSGIHEDKLFLSKVRFISETHIFLILILHCF